MSESKKTTTQAQNTLEVKITASETNGVLQFEGSVNLPGVTRSKLTGRDGVTKFDTISNVKAAARKVASRLKFEGVTYDDAAAQRRVAAKRAAASAPAPATAAN